MPLRQPPLGQVQARPPAVSPQLRDQRNRLDVHYHLNTPATVSSRIVSGDGQEWTLASNATRPTSGDYVLQFDGTVAGPGPNERRVLPDGDYQVVLDVQGGDSQHQQVPVPLTVSGADTTLPAVTDLALVPDHLSPNFDAQGDVTHLTYSLAKQAMVSAFLDSVPASGPPKRMWTGEEVKTPAGVQNLTWDGTANGQPVSDGQYMLGIRARDTAGNIVESSQPVVIEDSGVPEASIVSSQIGPLQIIRGDEVCLDTIVRNTGQTVLRTQGPEPGYVYSSLDNFSSVDNHAYAEHAGYWRVGLNWSGSTDMSGATYPYRWGFGHDLQPGDEVSVHGCVRVLNEQDQLVYAASLIQENVAIHNAGAGLVRIKIS
ncbi:MAG TPA: hypothetical protein VGJ60_23140 [Chloroflexota bacterium]|jgi:hypothetical protein